MDVENQQLVNAAIALGGAAAIALVLRSALRRYSAHVVARMPGDSASVATAWNAIARISVFAIMFIGVLVALSQFDSTSSFAHAALASSAVIAAIVGFASQATLSNIVSGLLIAVNQPIRLGDRVTIDGHQGRVEEIALSYTYVTADNGERLIFPNSLLVQRVVENATLQGGSTRAAVRVPVAEGESVVTLRERLSEIAQSVGMHQPHVAVADLADRAAVLEVRGWASSWDAARRAEDELREQVLTLREQPA